MDTPPHAHCQNKDANCVHTSTSATEENNPKTNSVLHLRLSFSSNGIQLLPPYLEQPVNLNTEQGGLNINDLQPILSILSNLSTSDNSTSIRPPVFNSSDSTTITIPSTYQTPHHINGASRSTLPLCSPSSSQPPNLTPTRSHSLDRERSLMDPSPRSKGLIENPTSKHRRSVTSPSSIPPLHSPSFPATDPPQVLKEHPSHPKKKRTRSKSPHPNEKVDRKSNREEFHSSGDFDQVSITFMNLPFQAKREELQSFFETCGPVKKCKFLLGNNKSFRGIAHVVYETPKSAEKAISLHNTMFRGREVSICYTDYSLVNRNSHSSSSESPDLNSSRNNNTVNKRARRDHYSSTVPSENQPLSNKTCTVILENLPAELSLDQIHDEASKNGNIIRVEWANRSKTAAYLEYSRPDSAKSAIKRLDKRKVNDSQIRASIFDSRSGRPSRTVDEKRRPFILKISDLPDLITSEQLNVFLKDVGPIEKLRVSSSRNTAYLEVWKDEVASAILAKDGQMLSESTIKIAPHHGTHRV